LRCRSARGMPQHARVVVDRSSGPRSVIVRSSSETHHARVSSTRRYVCRSLRPCVRQSVLPRWNRQALAVGPVLGRIRRRGTGRHRQRTVPFGSMMRLWPLSRSCRLIYTLLWRSSVSGYCWSCCCCARAVMVSAVSLAAILFAIVPALHTNVVQRSIFPLGDGTRTGGRQQRHQRVARSVYRQYPTTRREQLSWRCGIGCGSGAHIPVLRAWCIYTSRRGVVR